MRITNKKAIVWNEIGLWILAIAALVLIILGIFVLKSKGINLIDKLEELLRFRK